MKSVAICSFVLFVTSSIETGAQRAVDFEFGVRAGVPLTKPLELTVTPSPGFTHTFSMEKPGFTAGPTFGVVLYDRLVVQFDALYKPIQFVDQVTTPVATFTLRTSGGLWEFPLVFDYRFFKRAVRPYGGGGIVLGQTVFGTVESRGAFTTTGAPIKSVSGFGGLARQFPAYVVNAGFEWSVFQVAVRPEARYTRWDHSTGSPRRRQNEIDFLVGLSLTRLHR